jgi:hypothetical protein
VEAGSDSPREALLIQAKEIELLARFGYMSC